jgi:hypothetical protein
MIARLGELFDLMPPDLLGEQLRAMGSRRADEIRRVRPELHRL